MKTCNKCHVAKASECFRGRGHTQCNKCNNAISAKAFKRRQKTIEGQSAQFYKSIKYRQKKCFEGELIAFERLKAILQAQNGVCAETGIPFDYEALVASPDRINNDVGYVDGNIRFVTWRINRMRKNMPIARFHSTCMEVVNPNASRPVVMADNMKRFKIMYYKCTQRQKERKYEGLKCGELITFERFKAIYQAQDGVCAETGVPFDWASKDLIPSPDRIDNDDGYVDGNIRFVTWRINNMRGDLSVDDFRATCMQVVHHNKKIDSLIYSLIDSLMLRG